LDVVLLPAVRRIGHEPARTPIRDTRYAIRSLHEARAYLAHPGLGARLQQFAEAMLKIRDRSAREILGNPDDLKLRSSATLFALVSPPGSVFDRVLDRYFEGERDLNTVQLVEKASQSWSERHADDQRANSPKVQWI